MFIVLNPNDTLTNVLLPAVVFVVEAMLMLLTYTVIVVVLVLDVFWVVILLTVVLIFDIAAEIGMDKH